VTISIRQLREEQGTDQTLHNLLRALTSNLELRARYRVFEFEARQDGHAELAGLFAELHRVEDEQIAGLMTGLHRRLDEISSTGTAA
jgi:hypothetical protein